MPSRAVPALLLGLALGGCVAPPPLIPPPLALAPKTAQVASIEPLAEVRETSSSTRISETPKPPAVQRTETIGAQVAQPAAPERADITLAFEQVALPTMIQLVYGDILKKNFNIDPAVSARKDLVTLRTGTPQTPTQVENIVRTILRSYGLAVVDSEGLIRIVPDSAALGFMPDIRRGYALPETPLPLRPVFQLVELRAVRGIEVSGWLKAMFGNRVRVQDDPARNAVLLNGQSQDVMAALEAIHLLDQPTMKGRYSARISPAFWSADELSKRLVEILQAEGYNAGSTAPYGWSIIVLPVAAVGSVIAFAADQQVLDHVVSWAKELDKPTETGSGGRGLFSYKAQYTDATSLAKTLQQVLGTGAAASPATPSSPGAAAAPATRAAGATRVVVDQQSNMLIIQGGEDFSQIRSLLLALDKPAKEALIEVTIAEILLTDDSQLGVEWLAKEANLAGGRSYTAGTLGGLNVGSSGFNFRLFDNAGALRLVINALASNNRATILSSPRIVARNGETAVIQVGQEVPIVTSQQVVAGASIILPSTITIPQSIQYRNTGVILTVKPVIHSDDQVSLDISQEVSAAQSTTTGVSTSPTFGTRKVQTKLSLKNGATVLLGGLIASTRSEGNSGIPVLKDVPLLGQLFRTNTEKGDRTELIVLITAYVIGNHSDAEAITNAFKDQLGDWARGPRPLGEVPK